MLPNIQTLDCLLSEDGTQIGIGRAAVTNPPTGVYTELLEVREPSCLRDTRHFARRDIAKRIEVDHLLALRSQVRVQESYVAHLIIGIVGDILRHVTIKD